MFLKETLKDVFERPVPWLPPRLFWLWCHQCRRTSQIVWAKDPSRWGCWLVEDNDTENRAQCANTRKRRRRTHVQRNLQNNFFWKCLETEKPQTPLKARQNDFSIFYLTKQFPLKQGETINILKQTCPPCVYAMTIMRDLIISSVPHPSWWSVPSIPISQVYSTTVPDIVSSSDLE